MSEFESKISTRPELPEEAASIDEILSLPPEFDRDAALREGAHLRREEGSLEERLEDSPQFAKEFTLDLKAEIVRQARATVQSVRNVDHLSDAIKADLQRLVENYTELASEGGAALFSEIYYEAFEEAVSMRAEDEQIYKDAAELVAKGGGEKELHARLSELAGKIGLDGTPVGTKFSSAFRREKELYQLLVDKAANLTPAEIKRALSGRSRVSLNIRSELAALSSDPGFRALARRQEVRSMLSELLLGPKRPSLMSRASAQSGEGIFIPGHLRGGPLMIAKARKYLATSLVPLGVGLFLVLKAAVLALVKWIIGLFRKAEAEEPADE